MVSQMKRDDFKGLGIKLGDIMRLEKAIEEHKTNKEAPTPTV
jgi:hypothetical protein